ncbi:MAG TPA: PEP-CTERM sorting domain-containing protein, partial [Planctomycetaceae bacterium]|nr:PEP-CTERM sorting domain-containing protein [Planctomycetaceae bacterium]
SGNTGDILTDTSFDLELRTNNSQTINFFGYPPTDLLPPVTLDLATASTFSFGSTDFGFFTASSFAENATASPETRDFTFMGTFVPGTNPLFAGLTSNSARFVLQIDESGGVGNAYGGGGSLSVPFGGGPIGQTPAPSTLVMLATMCGPMAFGWWRRRRKLA